MNRRNLISCLKVSLGLTGLLWTICLAWSWTGASGAEVKRHTLQFAALRGTASIQRDERDIPYIEATNEDDLYFAQGYAVARDRLWQMDMLRRTASGELSEILGSATLEQDKQHRAFGFTALAEQMLGRLSPTVRAEVEAYARGVNAFIQSLDETSLPREFRALKYEPRLWRPADSLIIGKLFAETLSATWHTDMMRSALTGLAPEMRDELLPSVSPLDLILVGRDKAIKKSATPKAAVRYTTTSVEMLGEVAEIINTTRQSLERVGIYSEDLAASNNWVVNGFHSVTGKPLVANDPHLQPSVPSIWYLAHLTAPNLRVAGATVPGVPGIFIGHNDSIAWGITNVEADVQDVYVEKFDNSDSKRYLTPNGWRDAETRREKIKVRKSPTDTITETVEFDVTVTRHGPVVLDKEGKRYTLSWPTLDPTTNEVEAYYHINRARNWSEFRKALSVYTGFPLNFIYADVKNHIGYWAAGRYPIRRTGQGTVPYDGATDAGDWIGYIPFQSTPHLYDPPSGVIVTANNRTVGDDYPYYITNNWAAPFRARRIYDLLTSKEKLSVENFRAIQADTYSYLDAVFVAEVVKLGSPLRDRSPEWRELIEALEGSDAITSSGSSKIALSVVMRDAFLRRILAGALGDELAKKYAWSGAATLLYSVITEQPRKLLPKGVDSYQALVLASYKDALDYIAKRVGSNRSQWTWGRIAQVSFRHPLANAPFIGGQFAIDPIPQDGGNQTVNRGALVSMRFIADVANWDNTRQGIPLGQSGDPGSSHWKDQLESWRTVRPQIFPFSKDAVATATQETLLLVAPVAKQR